MALQGNIVTMRKLARMHSRRLLEVLGIIALYLAVSAWQQRGLLAADRTFAPPLKAANLAGQGFDLGSMRGRPVLVYFFAPWCRYCAASADKISFAYGDCAMKRTWQS